MKDRQPTNAGRVQLVPVAGQTNIYDMTMADGALEQGTPLNKATFLKDATAALYGLPNAVPDDVFAWLGKYNEHCWKKISTVYVEQKTDLTEHKAVTSNDAAQTISYASSISINGNREIELVNPSTITIQRSEEGANTLAGLAPCYITNLYDAGVYYLPTGSNAGTGGAFTVMQNSSIMKVRLSASASVKAQVVSANETSSFEFVFSTNRNAYPDSGIQDGYEYKYLGVPFDKLPAAPQIETGSYVGTGTYGSSNPNRINCSFTPKLVFIAMTETRPASTGSDAGRVGHWGRYFAILQRPSTVMWATDGSADAKRTYLTWQDNGVSWYSAHTQSWVATASQWNDNDTTYNWIAIG